MGKKEGAAFAAGIFVGAIIISILMGLTYIGDGNDVLNTEVFGNELCKAQGLVYDHRDFIRVKADEYPSPVEVPRIYCKNSSVSPVLDGVLVKVK